MVRFFIALTGILTAAQLNAFPCFITLAKDNCWANYAVTVNVNDAQANKQLTAVTIPQGKNWVRQPFTCQPGQKLLYTATFTPVIWQRDKNKVYQAIRYWSLPDAAKPNEKAWNLNVCYPRAFAEVPMTPEATANCQCDFTSIPPVPPIK